MAAHPFPGGADRAAELHALAHFLSYEPAALLAQALQIAGRKWQAVQ